MIKFWLLSLLVLTGYINTMTISVHAQSTPQIQITEINAFGSTQENGCKSVVVEHGRCAYDKWIELTNTSATSVSLSQYQLAFGVVPTTKNTIIFSTDAAIAPHSSVIIAYDEVNFVSASNAEVLDYSGKVLYLSNREIGQISVTLFDASRLVVDTVAIQKSFVATQNSYSFEKVNNEWVPATTEFSPHNFGTPGWIPGVVMPPEPVATAEPVLAVAPVIVENLAIATPIFVPSVSSKMITAPVVEKIVISLPAILEIPAPAVFATQILSENLVVQSQSIQLDSLIANSHAAQLSLASDTVTQAILPASRVEHLSKVHLEISWLFAALLVATTRVFVVALSRKTTIFALQTAMV